MSTPRADRRGTILRNSFWLGVSTVIDFVVSLGASVVVARLYGPEKLGYFSYLVWLVNITGALASSGIAITTRKYMAEWIGIGKLGPIRAILRLSFRLQILTSILLVAAGALFVMRHIPPDYRTFGLVALLSIPPSLIMSILSSANLALEDMRANVVAAMVSTAVYAVLLVAAILLGWGLTGIAAATLVSRVADIAVRYVLFQRAFAAWLENVADRTEQPLDGPAKKNIARFCLHATALQLLNLVVWDRSELIILERFSNVTQLAFYSTAFNVAQQALRVPQILATAAGAALMTEVRRSPDTVRRLAAEMLRYTALSAFPLTLGLAFLSGPAILLVYGGQYEPMIPVLGIVAAMAAAKSILFPVQQFLVSTDHQDVLVKTTCIVAVANIALDLWLIPPYGAIGAAVANGIAQTSAAVILWLVGAFRFKLQCRWMDAARVLACSALAGAAAWAASGLFRHPVAALAAGVPAGAAVYALSLRYARALDRLDFERLNSMAARLPVRMQGIYSGLVRFTVGAAAR